MSKDGDDPRWHPLWVWTLQIERRLSRLEGRNRDSGQPETSGWRPRDYLLTAAGVTMVIGSLTEKTGLTAVGLTVLKAVAKVYGEH